MLNELTEYFHKTTSYSPPEQTAMMYGDNTYITMAIIVKRTKNVTKFVQVISNKILFITKNNTRMRFETVRRNVNEFNISLLLKVLH